MKAFQLLTEQSLEQDRQGSKCRAGHNPFACYTLQVPLCQLALQPFPLSFPFRLIPLSQSGPLRLLFYLNLFKEFLLIIFQLR